MMVVMHDGVVAHPMVRHTVVHDVAAMVRRMGRGHAGRHGQREGGQRQGHEFHSFSPSLVCPNQDPDVRKATLHEGCYNLTT